MANINFLEKGIVAGLTFLLVGCSNQLLNYAQKILDERPSKAGAEYFSFMDKKTNELEECIFIFQKNGGDYWRLFKITNSRIGADFYKERRKKKPFSGGADFYTKQELVESCLEIDSFGNNDRVVVPEESLMAFKKKFPDLTLDDLISELAINNPR